MDRQKELEMIAEKLKSIEDKIDTLLSLATATTEPSTGEVAALTDRGPIHCRP